MAEAGVAVGTGRSEIEEDGQVRGGMFWGK